MRDDIQERIIWVAKHRGLITYGEIMGDFHVARGKQMGRVLEEISEYEHAQGRGFLTSIVVNKNTLEPSENFWSLPSISRDRGLKYYQNQVWDYWWNC
ncbi:MAG: hypothetical protein FJ023_02985 [Chloroflexi bacterium]|nr:hypothetical protein [Chloroflexota bacterium]